MTQTTPTTDDLPLFAAAPDDDPIQLIGELLTIAAQRRYQPGWIANTFKARLGRWPTPAEQRGAEPYEPSAVTLAFVREKHRRLAQNHAPVPQKPAVKGKPKAKTTKPPVVAAVIPDADALIAYYKQLRKAGGYLNLERETGLIHLHRVGPIPAWMVKPLSVFRDQIVADLLRVEHGITPEAKPEPLEGGAVLHRLPGRRPPELDPPIRQRRAGEARFDPGAA